MSEKMISFDRRKAKHDDLLRLHDEGYKVICPLCKSEVVFKTSGSWCSKNPNHYETHIYPADIARKMRIKSREHRIKESTANMKKKGYTKAQIQEHIDKYYPENK